MSISLVEKTAILYALLPILYFISGFLTGEKSYLLGGIAVFVLAIFEYVGIKLWYKTLVSGIQPK